MKSNIFEDALSNEEAVAWDSIKAVINNFLGKHRAENYHILVVDMLDSFESLGVHMSLKIHFLHHHLDYFENQLSSESDEHGERFHQIALPMEIRYNKKKLNSLIADICWWSQKKHGLSSIENEDVAEDEEIDYVFSDSESSMDEHEPLSKRRKTIG